MSDACDGRKAGPHEEIRVTRGGFTLAPAPHDGPTLLVELVSVNPDVPGAFRVVSLAERGVVIERTDGEDALGNVRWVTEMKALRDVFPAVPMPPGPFPPTTAAVPEAPSKFTRAATLVIGALASALAGRFPGPVQLPDPEDVVLRPFDPVVGLQDQTVRPKHVVIRGTVPNVAVNRARFAEWLGKVAATGADYTLEVRFLAPDEAEG